MGSPRQAVALALIVPAWLAAGYLWQLQDRLGPHLQRINVRFVEDLSVEGRQAFERQRGLVAGEDKGTRTWSYLLTDQSRENIGALVESPLVEDTHRIDRSSLHVEIESPDLFPLLRELLERRWLPYGSLLLVAAGFVLAWSARSSVARWIRAAPGRFDATASRLDTLTPPYELLIGFVLCTLFLAPMLWHGPTDDEEIALGIFSSQIYYRDLLHGRWSYWFTNLGFGTPMPLGNRLDFHPVFALGSLISVRVALSGLWIVQVCVMALYFFRLLAPYGLTPLGRLVFLGLYLFSMPSFLYFFATDWVSCQVAWTLYPVLVYYLRDAFMGGASTRWWLTTVRLGALFSLWVLNSHPGYLVPLFVVLAVYTLAAAPPTLTVYSSLCTAGVVTLAASAERVYFILHEMSLFPADVSKNSQNGYSLLTYLATQAAPLTELPELRQPFVGAFVFGAALAAPAICRTADRHVRACIIAFFVALPLTMMSGQSLTWTGLSAVWLFRDPVVFFGLLSAAAAVQPALRTDRRTVRRIALVLLALQGLQQIVVVSPDYRYHLEANSTLEWYRHQGRPFGVAAAVERAAARYGKRLYLSNEADRESRGAMSPGGIHVLTDYALLGLNPVNAWFKNVAMDRIFPSPVLMYGFIRGQPQVIDNQALLDVLGINVVVAMISEGLAPKGLTRLEHVIVKRKEGVDIFANPDAWPRAVLLSPDARTAPVPLVAGCEHTGALCRDYTALARTRLAENVALSDVGDGYRVRVPPSTAPRLLFVSAFYRPEWVATSGRQALEIEPIAEAFIGVTVPPGIQDIELVFHPRTRIALTWLSGLSLVGLLLALGVLTWRFRADERRFPASPKSRGPVASSPALR